MAALPLLSLSVGLILSVLFLRSGAGVPPQHSDAQQPDSGDDSGLHALQAGAAAQPAECKRCCWQPHTRPSDVIPAKVLMCALVSVRRQETTMRVLARRWRSLRGG